MNRKDFPALEQFLGGYFHQDFLLDYGTPDNAIVAFVREESRESVRAVCDELDRLLLLLQQGGEHGDKFLQELGCYYNPAADGLTARGWLEQVRKKLQYE